MEVGNILQQIVNLQKDIDCIGLQLEEEFRQIRCIEGSIVEAEERVLEEAAAIEDQVKVVALLESEDGELATITQLRWEEIGRLEAKTGAKEEELAALNAKIEEERESFKRDCVRFQDSHEKGDGPSERKKLLQDRVAAAMAEAKALMESLHGVDCESEIVLGEKRRGIDSLQRKKQQSSEFVRRQREENEKLKMEIDELKLCERQICQEDHDLSTMILDLDLLQEEEMEVQAAITKLRDNLLPIEKDVAEMKKQIALQEEEILHVENSIQGKCRQLLEL